MQEKRKKLLSIFLTVFFAGYILTNTNIVALAQTTVSLESFDSSLFPHIIANVSVRHDGTHILDLSSDDFQVAEKNVLQSDFFGVTPPDSNENMRLADIVFLIDVSGSMGGEIASVRNNVNNFANALAASSVDFTLGLVRFGNSSGANPYIFNGGNLTSDVTLFRSFVNTLSARGGFEPGFLAIRQAITGFNFRPGTQKIFIIITDEDSDDRNKQQTIDLLLANSVTVHAAANCPSGTSRTDYCDGGSIRDVTGGLLFNVWSDYSGVLDTIADTTSKSYVLRYRASNTAFDGIERIVEIFAKASDEVGSVVTSYTPGSAPSLVLTEETFSLISDNLPIVDGSPLTLSALVSDNIPPGVSSVKLFYRETGAASPYNPVSMVRDSVDPTGVEKWQYVISGANVDFPGVDFYITATDGQKTSSTPKSSPSDNPYQIAVLPNDYPLIEHTPAGKLDGQVGQDFYIIAHVEDNTHFVSSVSLFYREKGATNYTKIERVTNTTEVFFEEIIPGQFINRERIIEYYIEAKDNLGLSGYNGTAEQPHSFMPPNGDNDGDGLFNSEEDLNGNGFIDGDTNLNRTWDEDEEWTETDPEKADTDGDALLDGWEVHGYYRDSDTYYARPMPAPDLNLPAFCNGTTCTSPLRKDVFVEVDWMADSPDGYSLKPANERNVPEALNIVIKSFANSPVLNQDGSTGVSLHIDHGQGGVNTGGNEIEFVPTIDCRDANSPTGWNLSNFITLIRDNDNNFDFNNRGRIFHYTAFINSVGGGTSGLGSTPGRDFIVSLGEDFEGGSREEQAGTFMHELGHNLGLRHGGDVPDNFKPNYLSIMSYTYQFSGLWKDDSDGHFDYSRIALNELDESCLKENIGLHLGRDDHKTFLKDYGMVFYAKPGIADANGLFINYREVFKDASGSINWDRDIWVSEDSCQSRSVNNVVTKLGFDRRYEDTDMTDVFTGFNDWPNLIYHGGRTLGVFQGFIPFVIEEPHAEADIDFVKEISPYPPSGLAARATSSLVRLGWNPSNLEVITNYNVYRRTAGTDYTVLGNSAYSVFNDSNVVPGETYYYTVTAVSKYGKESKIIDEIQVVVPVSTSTRTR